MKINICRAEPKTTPVLNIVFVIVRQSRGWLRKDIYFRQGAAKLGGASGRTDEPYCAIVLVEKYALPNQNSILLADHIRARKPQAIQHMLHFPVVS
jgi:hypothetical protein